MPSEYEEKMLDMHDNAVEFMEEHKDIINKIICFEESYGDLSSGEMWYGLSILHELAEILGFEYEEPEDIWKELT